MPKVDLGNVIGPAGADATINGVNALTLAAGDNVTLTQSGAILTMSVDAVTESQMNAAIDAKVSSVYKAGGSATLATLPELSAANLGLVVNMTESFTTTSDFVEGAGKTYPAGSNVIVALIGSAYLYDVLAGFVDLSGYALKSEIPKKTSDLTNDSGFLTQHQSLADYVTKTDQSATDAAQNQEIADLKSENALLRELLNGIDAPIYRTASGNPAKFSDGYDNATLRNLTVTIPPTQDGTPSVETPAPIFGYSSVTVTRTGKNLLDFSGMTSGSNIDVVYSSDGNSVTFTQLRAGSAHSIKKNLDMYAFIGQTVTISVEEITNPPENAYDDFTGYIRIQCFDKPDMITEERTFMRDLRQTDGYRLSESVTITESRRYMQLSFAFRNAAEVGDVTTFVKPQIELGDERTAYEPYDGQSVTLSFVDANDNPLTVYGGTVDLISGKLTVTHDYVEYYAAGNVPAPWISDRDVYAPGKNPTIGANFVYPLPTPVAYQLTPVSFTSLLGYNCVSADAGTLAVTYRADTQLSFS